MTVETVQVPAYRTFPVRVARLQRLSASFLRVTFTGPDLDLFAEVTHISTYFATQWGEAIAGQLGVDPDSYRMDLDGIKAGFGVDPRATSSLTYRDLQKRRELIRSRLRGREAAAG